MRTAVVALLIGTTAATAAKAATATAATATAAIAATAAAVAGPELAQDGAEAVPAPGDSTVGPLFPLGIHATHRCTASVLNEVGDLLLTAAHCITGTGAGLIFVPGYNGTVANTAPYGQWPVTQVWVSPQWMKNQDPQHDYAVLKVADQVRGGVRTDIQATTGGNSLQLSVPPGTTVTVPAYPTGLGDAPITCTATTFQEQGFPGFDCGGYVGGTSGAPWLTAASQTVGRDVVGVIGGLNQGGCRAETSYSSQLDAGVVLLMIRAVLNLPGDNVPIRRDAGC